MRSSTSVSPSRSITSRRQSRYVSSRIGKSSNRRTACSRSLARRPGEPQRGALPRPLPRQQQRPRRVHAELRAEDRRAGQLGQQALPRLGAGQAGDQSITASADGSPSPAGALLPRSRRSRRRPGGAAEAQQDAVVAGDHLGRDPQLLAHRAGQGDPPGPVDPPAERASGRPGAGRRGRPRTVSTITVRSVAMPRRPPRCPAT